MKQQPVVSSVVPFPPRRQVAPLQSDLRIAGIDVAMCVLALWLAALVAVGAEACLSIGASLSEVEAAILMDQTISR